MRSDLAEGKSSGPDSVEKFVPLFSPLFLCALCLLLPKSEISTFLLNVEINFHPVTLNLTWHKAAFLSLPL